MSISNLDALMRDLAVARYILDHDFTDAVAQVWWPPTRRALMTLKDDVKAGLDSAMAKVRNEKNIEKGLRDTVAALQAQTTAMLAQIAAGQNQPGPWTDADMEEIKGGVQALNDALNPDAVVAAVTANVPPA